jgi:GNAT superfamily N-acetyltransferase
MKIRPATQKDLPYIIEMIANDKLGQLREDFQTPLPQYYYDAFDLIDQDANQELVVMVNDLNEIIGTMQLTFVQYLTYKGGIRAQIEAVRVREDQRGKGTGKVLFKWAIKRSKQKGAHLLQLTTDKKRLEALNFYLKLGFKASHEGMKMHFEL